MKSFHLPFELSIAAKVQVNDMQCSEIVLHLLFKHKLIRGEWFALCECGCDLAFIQSRQWVFKSYHDNPAWLVFCQTAGKDGAPARPPENHLHCEPPTYRKEYKGQLELLAQRHDLALWDETFVREMLRRGKTGYISSKQHAQIKRIIAQYAEEEG